jgi:NitT/TauT family transport system substrate-binding protein
MLRHVMFLFALLAVQLAASDTGEEEKIMIKIGHFPTLTHAQGLIGHALTQQEKGWFEQRLGPNVEVQWFVYNAGPSAMEAIFAESVDMTYVGPNPAVNAYLRSKGEDIRIVCGACSGGAALVIQGDSPIRKNSDFKGKKVGTPAIGNTQDVAARSWLKSKGFSVRLSGGDVLVIPTPSAEQLSLFKHKELDAVWAIEPVVSQLVLLAEGKVYLEESQLWPETKGKYVTTQLVSSRKFLDEHPDLVKKWIEAHIDLTEWMKQNPAEAKALANEGIKAIMTRSLNEEILDRAWRHLEFTYDPIKQSLIVSAERAYKIGFLRVKPILTNLYALDLLNQVLRERNLPQVD